MRSLIAATLPSTQDSLALPFMYAVDPSGVRYMASARKRLCDSYVTQRSVAFSRPAEARLEGF